MDVDEMIAACEAIKIQFSPYWNLPSETFQAVARGLHSRGWRIGEIACAMNCSHERVRQIVIDADKIADSC